MINVASAQGFTDSERATLDAAISMADAVLASGDFGPLVLRHLKKDGTPGFDDCSDTPAQILADINARFTAGIPLHFTIVNETIRMWFAHTVAEEEGGGVTFNRAKYTTENLPALTNTVVHETMHAVGYVHVHKALYPWTVPYGVGHIAEQIAITLSPLD